LPARMKPRAFALSFALLVVALFAPAAAQAGPLVASAPSCEDQSLSQPFSPWLDPSSYTLNSGGSFEDGAAGWSLNGASVASGNESYGVHGADDSHSLRLGASGSATGSTICVGIDHPTLRFFARNSGSPLSSLAVDVRFEDASGDVHSLPVGSVAGGSSWHPTAPYPVVANLLALLPGDMTPVQFRFTAHGGNWQIDDVYVDPWRNG
jgi:hypothetical protein